jgi:hypothetical protein
VIFSERSIRNFDQQARSVGGNAVIQLDRSGIMTDRRLNDTYLSALRLWMKGHIDRRKISLNAVAKGTDTGIATISRLMSEENATLPSLPTIFALERFFGDKSPVFGGDFEYFSKDEAMPVPEDHAPNFNLHQGLGLWKITSGALDALGIQSGDFMAVDMSATPRHNDIVLAEVKDWDRPEPYAIFRRYVSHPVPMLLALSTKKDFPSQIIVDTRSIAISGVAVGSYKPLRHDLSD